MASPPVLMSPRRKPVLMAPVLMAPMRRPVLMAPIRRSDVRSDMQRFWKVFAPLSCGGITLGLLDAFGMFYWSNILVEVLSSLFIALFGAFLGQQAGGLFA
jgi:hypothetical protein